MDLELPILIKIPVPTDVLKSKTITVLNPITGELEIIYVTN